ncbi:MAG: hypothetical protein E7171_08460 [Firmicutes bacterium]|nr:hypothetical protein [Bacillota bacterium]
MNILNFIYDIANSDALYYILIILLVIISLVMVYLMYSQNKELSKHLMEKNKQVKNEEKEDVKKYEEVESLDGREELLEVSRMTIPKHLEYTQSLFSNTELEELQSISKDIEENYKERQNDIDTYEEEQEESAIISYDELLSKTQVIPKVEEKEIKETKVVDENYSHEEDFLNRLRNLNDNLK